MNLDQLPYILEIAATQNLSGAAARLGVSQPALSKYLSTLERELGTELFARYRKRLYPTAAGYLYLDMARHMVDIQDRTMRALNMLHSEPTEQLTIGVSPHRGAAETAAIYPEFIRRYPHIRLGVKEGYNRQLREYLRQNEVSLVIGTLLRDDQAQYPESVIHHEELVLALPDYHRLAAEASADPDTAPIMDLARFQDSPFVMMDAGSSVGEVCETLFAEQHFSPLIVYRTANITMACSLVCSGLGISIIPKAHAARYPDLRFYRLQSHPRITMAFLWRPSHRLTEPERYLIYLFTRQTSANAYYEVEWGQTAERIWNEFHAHHGRPSDSN